MVLPHEDRSHINSSVKECESLLATFGAEVLQTKVSWRHHVASKSYIGHQKLVQLTRRAEILNASLIVINRELKPGQIYVIEKYLEDNRLEKKITVWDRVDLVISIFSKHAKSAEAKLQLELAKIEHFGPRIFGMGDELSQQGGGIGTRGIGETNTEIMKRHISLRKKKLHARLNKLKKTRIVDQKKRKRNGLRTISVVGYTNAGKSALFRKLTKRQSVSPKNRLFATLDVTTAKMYLPKNQRIVLLSDTIGFIQDLPHHLIDAFHSTFLEIQKSDLIIHLIDISSPTVAQNTKAVNKMLEKLNCQSIPKLIVFNKIDKLAESDLLLKADFAENLSSQKSIYISCKTGAGLEQIKNTIADMFFGDEGEKLEGANDEWKSVPVDNQQMNQDDFKPVAPHLS